MLTKEETLKIRKSLLEALKRGPQASSTLAGRWEAVMTDRKLLKMAAKAAGIEGQFTLGSGEAFELLKPYGFQLYWNPLKNDGDAFRLAVKLGIDLVRLNLPTGVGISAYDGKAPSAFERYTDDPYAATRRAIVRAAAEIVKQMDGNNDIRK